MIYLQKVIALVEAVEYERELSVLGRTLQAQGVIFYGIVGECAVQLWESSVGIHALPIKKCDAFCSEAAKQADGDVGADKFILKEKSVRRDTQGLGQKSSCMEQSEMELQQQACLWLTDKADWANFLVDRGQAVLAFLHEENRLQNFSKIQYACENPSELDAGYLDRVYRRYRSLPWDILDTKRCYIRETTEADVPLFYEIYKEPEITRYMEKLFPEMEQELQYIKDYREKIYDFYGFGVWTVLKKDTGEVIGRAGLSYREGYEEPELGFIIGVPWQRQGYAEEVCRAILAYGREEYAFETVQALVMPENLASAHLCEKLGFCKTGQVELGGKRYDRFVRGL